MILDYNSIYENEKSLWQRFIGYITPEGEMLDYSNPFGLGSHDRNFMTDMFTRYFYNDTNPKYSRLINDEYLKGEEYKEAFRDYCLEVLPKKCQTTIWQQQEGYHIPREEHLELRIRNLLLNCYQNSDFFQGYGRSLYLISRDDFEKMYIATNDVTNLKYWQIDEQVKDYYNYYYERMILSYFKDTLVQYLGYDSVEMVSSRTICTLPVDSF